MQAKAEGFKGIVIPIQNFNQVAMIKGIKIVPVKHLNEVVTYFQNNRIPAITAAPQTKNKKTPLTDFSEVHAQEHAKRAMEIAAAGGHNLLLIGPPGAGKSMLAERMPSILPDLKIEEAISSTSIHSLVSKHGTMDGLMKNRPYRAPHHTISDVALVGGGTNPKPGEISMAHNGILFLDELPEFKRSTLEVLRQPLENNMVQISRSNLSVEFPASFTLIAAMNPCPCGYFTHPNKSCKCTKKGIEKYKSKISGPLLDRIDLHIQVAPITFHEIQSKKPQEQSRVIKKRVLQARNIQGQRTKNERLASLNAKLSISQIKTYCSLNEEGSDLLKNAMQQLNLSARAYHKILKISRTIADLDGEYDIQTQHVAEAIQYRCLDRELL
jgi:magnesium chelatase family protein